VDADNTDEVIALIQKYSPDILINVALPYQDLTIMDACIATKTPYLDTANYEHPDEAKFEYKLQWARDEKFKEAGIMGLLGSGFDPGATNVSAPTLKNTISTRSTRSISSTVTQGITAIRSLPTSTLRLTCVK
jgi:saccharopine dehydrogenase-like NADP-dependent oxidoreductase